MLEEGSQFDINKAMGFKTEPAEKLKLLASTEVENEEKVSKHKKKSAKTRHFERNYVIVDKFEEYMEFLNWKKTHSGGPTVADKIKHYAKKIAILKDSKDGEVPDAKDADAGKAAEDDPEAKDKKDADASAAAKDNAKTAIDEAVDKIKKEDEKVVEEQEQKLKKIDDKKKELAKMEDEKKKVDEKQVNKAEKEKDAKDIINKIEKAITDKEAKKAAAAPSGVDSKNGGAVDVKVVVEVKKPAGDAGAKTDVKVNGKPAVIADAKTGAAGAAEDHGVNKKVEAEMIKPSEKGAGKDAEKDNGEFEDGNKRNEKSSAERVEAAAKAAEAA